MSVLEEFLEAGDDKQSSSIMLKQYKQNNLINIVKFPLVWHVSIKEGRLYRGDGDGSDG